MGSINPVQNSKNIDRHVLMAERLLVALVALAGSAFAFRYIWQVVAAYTDLVVFQWAGAVVAAVAAAFITDFAFRNFLTEAVFWPFALFHPDVLASIRENSRYFSVMRFLKWVAITAIVAGLFYLDWGTIQNVRAPIAAGQRQIEKTDVAEKTGVLNAEMSATLIPIRTRIKEVQAAISSAEKRVGAENPKLVDLAKDGNGWAQSKLRTLKNKATATDRQELDKLNKSLNSTIEETTGAVTATAATLNAENARIDQVNAQNQASLSNMVFLFGGWLKLLTVACRVFLVLSFLSKAKTLDVNGDGVVDGRDVTSYARGSEEMQEPDFQ